MLRPHLVAAGLTLAGALSAQEGGLAEGQHLADLTLPMIGGAEPVSLGELQGKRVLLIVFASW